MFQFIQFVSFSLCFALYTVFVFIFSVFCNIALHLLRVWSQLNAAVTLATLLPRDCDSTRAGKT